MKPRKLKMMDAVALLQRRVQVDESKLHALRRVMGHIEKTPGDGTPENDLMTLQLLRKDCEKLERRQARMERAANILNARIYGG